MTKDFKEDLKQLYSELCFLENELDKECAGLIRYFKRTKSLSCYSNYNELNSKRKKILIKINQIRLKNWYWK